jgi:ABC-type Fe3+-hydroxamate transport system substrate-binding protein
MDEAVKAYKNDPNGEYIFAVEEIDNDMATIGDFAFTYEQAKTVIAELSQRIVEFEMACEAQGIKL